MEKNARSDGLATKQLLLKVAARLFSEKGYERTTSKEICKLAQTNVASVNYHFGCKLALYQQVLIDAHNHLINIDFLIEVQRQSICPWQKLDQVIEKFAHNVLQDDWYARLFTREVFSPTPDFTEALKEIILGEIHPKIHITKTIISEILDCPVDHPAVTRCAFNIGAPYILMLAVHKDICNHLFNGLLTTTPDNHVLIEHFKNYARGGLMQIKQELNNTLHST